MHADSTYLIIGNIFNKSKEMKSSEVNNQMFTYEEVKELLLKERRRAVDIAYSFKEENEKSAQAQKEAGSRIYFVKENVAEECRYVGNSISGLNGLSHAVGETTETIIERNLLKYLENRKLSAEYVGDQTPAERLRNCLSPYTTLVQLLFENEKYIKFNINVDGDETMLEIINRTIDLCKQSNKDVKAYLSDIEQFYSK